MRLRKFTAITALVLAVTVLPAFQSVGGKIANSRTICLKAGAKLIGPISVPSNIPGARLVLTPEIAGYAAPGETAGLQVNGDTGNNYTLLGSTTTDGITYAAWTNNAVATDRIRIGAADTQQQRIATITINDNSAKQEHIMTIVSAVGTGSTAASPIDRATAKYFAPSPTALTSVQLVTTNANMGAGSCLTVSW
jgi:hypothetical protein